MKVGFIGLGRMGQGMARRVLDGGHDLIVYDRSGEKASGFADTAARVATSIAGACDGREVIITMLSDDAALHEVALAPGGLRSAMAAGAIHVAMGTHGVAAITALAAAHRSASQELVAAPVLGRPDLAAAGQLGIVAAGPAETLQRCAPLFEIMGRRTFHAGATPESATVIKLANSFVLGCAIEAMGEAFSLVRKHGVTPATLYEVLTEGLFSAPAYKIYGKIMVEESYDRAGFTAQLGLKDFNLTLGAADAARVPLPSANAVRDRLLGAIAHGDAQKDWAVIAYEQGRASGLN